MPIDVGELEAWARKIETAQAALKPEIADCLEEIGERFLDMVQEEIEKAKNLDTRLLLSSFSRGSANNVWKLDAGALELTVGSALDYASYVNDGHNQTPGRFIPGVWSGDRFTYIKGASTGMVLRASYVEGSGYFDNAVDRMARESDKIAKEFFEQFWHRYFG